MIQTFVVQLEIIQCAHCSMTFGITSDFFKRRKEDHKEFICPNGHSNFYNSETEGEKLRRENERLKQNAAYKDDQIDRERKISEHERNRSKAFKGHLTRTKNRVGRGVCPCCNRTFSNLLNHMATQHKDYAKEEVTV